MKKKIILLIVTRPQIAVVLLFAVLVLAIYDDISKAIK